MYADLVAALRKLPDAAPVFFREPGGDANIPAREYALPARVVIAVVATLEPVPPATKRMQVTATIPLNVRVTPSTSARVVRQLRRGHMIEVQADPVKGWYALADLTGWVSGDWLAEVV
jgi:uncharacterized protein YraI